MMINTWVSRSIFLSDINWYEFLFRDLNTKLSALKSLNQINLYYIMMGNNRGDNISVFLRVSQTIFNISEFDQWLEQTVSHFKDNSFHQEDGEITSLFKNIPSGTVCYDLLRDYSDIIYNTSFTESNIIFEILNDLSWYLISIDKSTFQLVRKNKTLFCFSFIVSIFLSSGHQIIKFKSALQISFDEELEKTEALLGRSIEPSLSKLYLNNKTVLINYIEKINDHKDRKSFSFIDERFQVLIKQVSQKDLIGEESSDIFKKILINQICSILNIEQKLICLFFINKYIDEAT